MTKAIDQPRNARSRRSRAALLDATRELISEGGFDALTSLQRVWDSPHAVTALAEWGRHLARIHPKILPVMQAAERARHVDADAAELWRTAQRGQLAGARRLADWLAREGRLAPPWTAATAADMIWSLMSATI
jgi:hypothetical protein